ncbi:MAG: glycosyltransferase family 39 protein, partial [Candidatus Margulisiibacteriota bacterium]
MRFSGVNPYIFVGLAVIVNLLFSFPHLGKPFIYDEIEFVNFSPILTLHPPLYVSCIWMLKHLFGAHEWVFRAFGMVCGYGAALFIYLITQYLRPQYGWVAVVLYVMSPLVIQGGLIPDIDNTILPMIILGILYTFLRMPRTWKRLLMVSLFCFVALMAKTTTIYAVMFGLIVAEGVIYRRWQSALSFLVAFLMVGALFHVTLYELSVWSHLNFYVDTLAHNHVKVSEILSGLASPITYFKIAYNAHALIVWISLFWVALLLIKAAQRFRGDMTESEKTLYLILFLT